jgi:hypothetical protein
MTTLPGAPRRLGTEGLGQGGELEDRRDHRAQLLAVDEERQPAHLPGVGPDDEVPAADVVPAAAAFGRRFGDGNQGGAAAQHLPGARRGVAADGVDHDIDVTDLILEAAV